MKKLIRAVLIILAVTAASQANATPYNVLNSYMPQSVGDKCNSNFDCDMGEYCYGGGFGKQGICLPRQ